MPDLNEWRTEIESATHGRIVTVPVETDAVENVLRIPPSFPGRQIVRQLLLSENFVRQFIRTHALNVNYSSAESRYHFILVNLARREDWAGLEDVVLAHEYGHIWLNAKGYASPAYENCATTVAGDIVQHPLIFVETRRRGFAYDRFWLSNLTRWMAEPATPGTLPLCERLIVISHWMDALMSFTETTWPEREAFLTATRTRFPDLAGPVDQLWTVLRGSDLWDQSVYQSRLKNVLQILSSIHQRETIPPAV